MYYSVHKGKKTGIFNNWNECKINVQGFPNAIFKKFKKKEDAEYFLKHGNLDNKNNFLENHDSIIVFTDGSCRTIDKKVYGGIGIYFGSNDLRNRKLPFIDSNITNNRAELYAIYQCLLILLNIIKKEKNKNIKIKIYSDSEYSLKSTTIWYKNWKLNQWLDQNNNLRKNIDLIQKIVPILENHPNIQLLHVKAHTNNKDFLSIGNNFADKFAEEGLYLGRNTYLNLKKLSDDNQ